ncbi:hypothetical protein K466DRAFT_406345 [Polyporus arcularius HHB13444]|uniref:Uncharacterized protein n=1 Tax=Polyporus arcularius HHB13444 TaxID=1314778 RepID=A0A5C3NRB5_9APHY|nr:hypothetical protein K466DRAFT_406345 [Polyporus arcularius HHB13444]
MSSVLPGLARKGIGAGGGALGSAPFTVRERRRSNAMHLPHLDITHSSTARFFTMSDVWARELGLTWCALSRAAWLLACLRIPSTRRCVMQRRRISSFVIWPGPDPVLLLDPSTRRHPVQTHTRRRSHSQKSNMHTLPLPLRPRADFRIHSAMDSTLDLADRRCDVRLNRVRLVYGNAGAYAVECLSVDNAATAPGASWITEDERARGRMQGRLRRTCASSGNFDRLCRYSRRNGASCRRKLRTVATTAAILRWIPRLLSGQLPPFIVHSFMVAMSSNCHRCASLLFPPPPCIAVRQAHAYTPGSHALNIRCLPPFGHARPVTQSNAAPQWLLRYPSQMQMHDRIHVGVRCSPSL